MNRKPFTPQPGTGYWNQGGGTFDCLSVLDDGRAVMRNRASGWTLTAHGVGIYDDGSIDWDYSTDGRFEEKQGQQDAAEIMAVLTAAVDTWGKAAQVDMAIEEMAELQKELLNERRGRGTDIPGKGRPSGSTAARQEGGGVVNWNEKRKCPVCGREVTRGDMNFTRDCHGITFRLVCLDCWDRLMEKGYDGEYYDELDEQIEPDY